MTKPSRAVSNGREAAVRVVVAGRERAHRGEPADERLVDAGLGAAGDHHVGVAAADDLARLADRVAAGGAGRHGREVRPGHPELDRDLAGPDVRDAHRDEERADPVRAAQGVGRDAVDERPDAAEPGPEDDPGPLGELALEPGRQPGLVERLARGDQRRTGCSGPSGAGPCGRGSPLASKSRTSPAIRTFSRDGSKASIVRIPERPATRPSQVVGDVVAEGGHHAHPGHDDAASLGRSSDQLPGADGGGAVDVAGEAAGRDRVGDRERVELGAPDLGGHGSPSSMSMRAHDAVGSPSKT